jgi:hypothetical protein
VACYFAQSRVWKLETHKAQESSLYLLSFYFDMSIVNQAVPTFPPKDEPRQIRTLKKSDPFMFFSIPAAKDAVIYNKDIDIAALGALIGTLETTSSDEDKNRVGVVKRQTCISFECHPDLLLDFEALFG